MSGGPIDGIVNLIGRAALIGGAFMLLCAGAAHAQHGAHGDLFVSSDADGNEVQRAGAGWDWRRDGLEIRRGFKLEHARYAGDGWSATRERAFLRFADVGARWHWSADVGTDGQAVIGTAALFRDVADRTEWFVERDLVETRRAVDERVYATLFGLSRDQPLGTRLTATAVLAWQDFTGDNRKLLGRGIVTALLSETHGLSAQLHLRHLDNSHPGEYDYYAPAWYREALLGLQWRRFHRGHQVRVRAAAGRQQARGTDATPARMLDIEWQSPKRGAWFVKLNANYSNVPINAAYTYDYRSVRVEVVRLID